MRKYFILIFCIFVVGEIGAKNQPTVLTSSYIKNMYGILYKRPSINSAQLTVLSCGRTVKVMEDKQGITGDKWHFVEAGIHKGFVPKRALVDKHPVCFARRYPKFLENMNLEMLDFHIWGRLYDKYTYGASRAMP